MDFRVPEDAVTPVGLKPPKIHLNDSSVQGAYSSDLNGKFELRAEGEFAKDLYLTIAYSTGEGHISANTYTLDKSDVNEVFPLIAQAIGVPRRLLFLQSQLGHGLRRGNGSGNRHRLELAGE